MCYQLTPAQTFMTMCTPHLSSRRVGGVFGHYGKAIWQKMVHYFVQTQGETGKELLLADSENGAAPLLVRMTDPGTQPIHCYYALASHYKLIICCVESIYMKALRRFKHPTASTVTRLPMSPVTFLLSQSV